MSLTRELTAYVGAYTRRLPHVEGHGEGIYRLRLDADTGALTFDGVAARMVDPTFLALDPVRPQFYAVTEQDQVAGRPGAALHAFAINAEPGARRGALTRLNWRRTGGAASCHVAVDRAGRCALTANYSGGNVTVLPIADDGRLAPMTQRLAHAGAGPAPARQEKPHPHGVYFDRTGRYLFVPDLGIDKVCVYRFDAEHCALTPQATRECSAAGSKASPWAVIHPGAGPRHLALHPNGRWVYCINELDVSVSTLVFDAEAGVLVERGWVSLLPQDADGRSSAAEIAIDAAGRFVYASIRRHDSIATLAVTPDDGALTLLGHEPTRGRTPRHFALSPDGRLLVVANQDSDSLVTFHVDGKTGGLTPSGHSAAVPSPACVLMLETKLQPVSERPIQTA